MCQLHHDLNARRAVAMQDSDSQSTIDLEATEPAAPYGWTATRLDRRLRPSPPARRHAHRRDNRTGLRLRYRRIAVPEIQKAAVSLSTAKGPTFFHDAQKVLSLSKSVRTLLNRQP